LDFRKVLDTVTRFLDERGFRYALAGAFALSTYGFSRATQDIDFVLDLSGQRELIAFLESLGYETLHRSEGYSNHIHPLPGLGRVDFIYVGEPTATRVFENAVPVPVFGRTIRVPRPEHLAAMKILAMKNDPTRTDLQQILGIPDVDMNEIRAHFERYGLLGRFDELRRILSSTES